MSENTAYIAAELEELIPRYLENRRADVEIARVAFARGDMERLRSLGHTIKGTAASYGFTAISEIGYSLERAAANADAEAAGAAISNLERYLNALVIVYVDE